MCKVYIVGNPNSGKTTLFNSLTKSSEHVGNWHGVTVDKKSKFIQFKSNKNKNLNDEIYEIIDLPGIYSLNAFSLEEQVSIDEINTNTNGRILYLIDANNFKRSMLLALTLLVKNKNIKILINNYKYFERQGGNIDTNYLSKVLGCEVEIVDAKRIKPSKQFFNFSTRETAFIKTLRNELNITNNLNCDSISDNLNCGEAENNNLNQNNQEIIKNNKSKIQEKYKNIEITYKYITKIANNCVKNKNKIYGYSKIDNKLLKLSIFLPSFILIMFAMLYIIFFLIGPIISDLFLNILYFLIQKPIMAIIKIATKSSFIIALFEDGIFNACFSVLGFLPQICLVYLFLSILENSGLISRMAFLFDDALQKVGLNGKMVYTMLMGFGCSTSATLTAKNMPDKNAQIKASLLTPFMSCSAKLPIYATLGLALLGVKSIWLILGLYLLGIVVAIILGVIFERTILPSKDSGLLIEFPPLKAPSWSNAFMSMRVSCKQFLIKVFGVIFCASVVIWLLSNINIKFQYIGETSRSILYSFSSIISWIFKPIGLDNPNIICALLIGLVAKELILSSFAISNKVASLTALGTSLTLTTSAVNFNIASGISFLVFTLLYFPCISNFGVLLKEIGVKHTLFGVLLQLCLAYLTSWLVYNAITKGLSGALMVLVVMLIVAISFKIMFKKIKTRKICDDCLMCDKCKNR